MNYVYDPKVQADIAEYVNYVTPVSGVKQILAKRDPALARNQLIFPSRVLHQELHLRAGARRPAGRAGHEGLRAGASTAERADAFDRRAADGAAARRPGGDPRPVRGAGRGGRARSVPTSSSCCCPSFISRRSPDRSRRATATSAEAAVEIPGPLTDRLGELAVATGLWLVPGLCLRARRRRRIHNTALAISPSGELVAALPQGVPLAAARAHDARRPVRRLRDPRRRPGRAGDLLRRLLPRGLSPARLDGRRGRPPADPDDDQRPRRGAGHRAGERDRQPALRRQRQRRRPGRPRPQPDRRPRGPGQGRGRARRGAAHRRPRPRRGRPACAASGPQASRGCGSRSTAAPPRSSSCRCTRAAGSSPARPTDAGR